MRVCIHTFGCQMNKLDSELVAEALRDAGHELVTDEADAEAILFNTCSVRDHAEERVLQRLRQLRARKEADPSLVLGVMGCQAQREGAGLLKTLPFLDLICGTRQFPRIAVCLEEARIAPVIAVEEEVPEAPGILAPHPRTLHRGIQGYVSVMRGCDNYCAYCIVPYVRGAEESRPAAAIVSEAQALVEHGAREIILLGQNVDAYGKKSGSSLAALLRRLHDEVPGALRIRFVTSHPRDVTRELVETMAELPRVCNHLHMPAQSGSTRILQAMRRGYTRAMYDERLAMIRECAPETLLTSDFIVGFPTETEADFQETLALMEYARFQTAFVFRYSPRPGTLAARTMPDDVPLAEKKRRNQILLDAHSRVCRERSASLLGTEQTVLAEGVSGRDARRMTGRTGTNLICVFEHDGRPEAYTGKLVTLRIEECTPLTLHGRVVRVEA